MMLSKATPLLSIRQYLLDDFPKTRVAVEVLVEEGLVNKERLE